MANGRGKLFPVFSRVTTLLRLPPGPGLLCSHRVLLVGTLLQGRRCYSLPTLTTSVSCSAFHLPGSQEAGWAPRSPSLARKHLFSFLKTGTWTNLPKNVSREGSVYVSVRDVLWQEVIWAELGCVTLCVWEKLGKYLLYSSLNEDYLKYFSFISST